MAYLTEEDLFEFQKEDVAKLRSAASCLIGNEMGTGKTYEAVALDWFRRNGDHTPRTLVLCNLSQGESTWAQHFRKLTPMNVFVYDPKDKRSFIKALKAPVGTYQVFVIHWEAMQTRVGIVQELQKYQWYHIIADECQKMKNRKNQTTVNFKKIKATFRTAMSGTPVTNKPHDFWSTLNWLWPSKFRSYWAFYKRHVEYEITYPEGYHKIKGPINVGEILDVIGPYYVRHLKKERCCEHHPHGVMAYLPDKIYEERWVDLTPDQREAYNAMNKEMVAWVGEHKDKPLIAPVVISKLVRLQQFAIAHCDVEFIETYVEDPLALPDEDGYIPTIMSSSKVTMTEPSAKLDACMEDIFEHYEEGQQIVIFSQFSQAIRLLGDRLSQTDVPYALFTGDTPRAERAEIISGFLSGDIKVFAGTIKAGGVGLDLYTASTVGFLDRSWSPAENKQAEDRLHRHGQKNSVRVIDYMARNTIDWQRKQDINLKWEWIRILLGDTNG